MDENSILLGVSVLITTDPHRENQHGALRTGPDCPGAAWHGC